MDSKADEVSQPQPNEINHDERASTSQANNDVAPPAAGVPETVKTDNEGTEGEGNPGVQRDISSRSSLSSYPLIQDARVIVLPRPFFSRVIMHAGPPGEMIMRAGCEPGRIQWHTASIHLLTSLRRDNCQWRHVRLFMCRECRKFFLYRKALIIHRRVHAEIAKPKAVEPWERYF